MLHNLDVDVGIGVGLTVGLGVGLGVGRGAPRDPGAGKGPRTAYTLVKARG